MGKLGKLVIEIFGNNYCQNVQGEHETNEAYFVVDLQNRHFTQRCTTAFCYGYQSPAIKLDSVLFTS